MTKETAPENRTGKPDRSSQTQRAVDGSHETDTNHDAAQAEALPKHTQSTGKHQQSAAPGGSYNDDLQNKYIDTGQSIDRTERIAFWTLLATSVLAVGTFILALATFDMAYSTRQLVSLAKQQAGDTQTALQIAGQQAGAVTNQARTMESELQVFREQLETANYQLRSNIRLLPAPAPAHEPDGRIFWNVSFTNIGQRDASDVNLTGYLSLTGSQFRQGTKSHNSTMGPGESFFNTIFSSDNFTDPQYQELLQINQSIRIFVVLKFRDQSNTAQERQICLGRNTNGTLANIDVDVCRKGLSTP